MHTLAGAKLVEEYVKRLNEEHGDNCPWRNKGCDGDCAESIVDSQNANNEQPLSNTCHWQILKLPSPAFAIVI